MLDQPINVLSWNIRGLNDPAHRSTVNEMIVASLCHLVCLQEMKLDSVDRFTTAFLGGNRLNGTRGGILLLWDNLCVDVGDITCSTYCLLAMIHVKGTETHFKLTTVYGPINSASKDAFFMELIAQNMPNGVMWLATGDINKIHRARDKNKGNVNRSRINRFRAALHT